MEVVRTEIHVTDTSIFRSCRLRWHWQSKIRRNLQPIAPPRALWLGTGIHVALEDYYEGIGIEKPIDPAESFETWALDQLVSIQEEFPEMDPGRIQQFDEDVELGKEILNHYSVWAPEHDNFRVVAVERSFTIPDFLPPRQVWLNPQGFPTPTLIDGGGGEDRLVELHIDLCGRGDGVVEDAYGDYWVLEHKTTAVMDTQRLILEEQPGVYQWAMAQELGHEIKGTIFNFLRKKIPARPQTLVAGGLSQRSNIDTTYEVYMACLKEAGEDPAEYEELLTRLKDRGNTFFLREQVVRSPNELDRLITRIQKVAEEMISPSLQIYASPDILKCKMCTMQGPCIALNDGSDYQFILGSQYRVRPSEAPSEPLVEEGSFI